MFEEVSVIAKRGPKTDAGKEVARLNATQHGIFSDSPVIAGIESQKDWEAYRAGTFESLAPQGHLESELADRIALLLWRLRRVARYERNAIEVGQERIVADNMKPALSSFGPSFPRGDPDELARTETELTETLDALQHFGKRGKSESMDEDDALFVLETVLEDFEKFDFSDAYADLEEDETWTVEEVRRRLDIVASTFESTGERLVASAIASTAEALDKHREKAKQLAVRLEQMSRERLLPTEDVVNKVTRYESHLHRQLLQTMHELEALQARRQGNPAPLARLDIATNAEGDDRQQLLEASQR